MTAAHMMGTTNILALAAVTSVAVLIHLLFLHIYLKLFCDDKPYACFRIVGGDEKGWFNGDILERWQRDAGGLIKQGFLETQGGPFQLMSSQGPLVILPPSLVNHVLMDSRLSFAGGLERLGLKALPGIGRAHTECQREIVFGTVLKPMTRASTALTETLSAEAEKAISELFPVDESKWQSTDFATPARLVVTRVSAVLFVGPNLAHNVEWQEIAQSFASIATEAELARRRWPVFMRRFLDGFLQEPRKLKDLVDRARRLIDHELATRNRSMTSIGAPNYYDRDCLDWFEQLRGDGEFDVVFGQLFLVAAGTHNVSLTMTSLMYDLLLHPELIHDLRAEAVKVITESGWTKSSLDKLRLLDSCMRETQRYRITDPVLYRRAEEPVTLPDGTFLAKGTHTAFPSPRALGAPGDKFHCGRVMAVRTPEMETRSQFSSTGLDYLSMGHGRTACPGRFFASVEIKICFVHLLLKYDWKAVGQIPLGAEVREKA
ncbi:Putative cytochrome P450 [Colletotrichum destructivum]|uniref:Cytochrome P450 n=1 Tax=Colletotrichum destructivum TaxID=34406 RepID=A0AAX4IXT0_9PEZI|nr:Putative cytochrome P450 [Colletotrichum destructivum]